MKDAVRLSPDCLVASERQRVGELWLERCRNELTTSKAFAELHRTLPVLGVTNAVFQLSARAEGDERRHAGLCLGMAQRYLGEVREPQVDERELPRFGPHEGRARALLAFVQHCCFSETIATAYVGACRDRARVPEARSVLKQILADEVVHSRLGWAVVAQATDQERDLLARVSVKLLRSAESWLRGLEPFEGIPAGHGFLNAEELRQVFFAACSDLVLPGFVHHGINVDGARRELDVMRATS